MQSDTTQRDLHRDDPRRQEQHWREALASQAVGVKDGRA